MGERFYTAGYEGRTREELVELLRTRAIRLLLDVRELPLSRKKGFSRTPLRDFLESHGIEYRHLKALGNPRPLRHRLRRDGDFGTWSRDFGAHLDTQGEALREAADLLKRGPACLLCYERDPAKCHRLPVAERLSRLTGFEAVHL